MSTIEASGGFLKASVLLFCVFSVSFVTFFVLWLEGTYLIMAAACRILSYPTASQSQRKQAGVISDNLSSTRRLPLASCQRTVLFLFFTYDRRTAGGNTKNDVCETIHKEPGIWNC